MYDLIVIGAGPCGLAVGIEAAKAGLNYLVIDKGSITEAIRRYPKDMLFFSTAPRLEIGGLPFACVQAKPNRAEALQYYRRAAEHYALALQLHTEISHISKEAEHFVLQARDGRQWQARRVVLATGYFDCPKYLGITGEDLPHVSHYYDEPYQYVHQRVVIIGGGNSAVETALNLYRHNVRVTMVMRGADFKPSAKYWLIPDLCNRVKAGDIQVLFEANVQAIYPKHLEARTNDGILHHIEADYVLALTGYTADIGFLREAGVQVHDTDLVPYFDPDTLQTNISGLYLAGTVTAGAHTERVFIENGRFDGEKIIRHITTANAAPTERHYTDLEDN